MIYKINDLYDRILAVSQGEAKLDNIVLGPVENITSFGPLSYDPAKVAKFLINDVQAIRKKFNIEFYDYIDPKKLIVLFALSDTVDWFSRKELVEFLEYKLNDFIRDSE